MARGRESANDRGRRRKGPPSAGLLAWVAAGVVGGFALAAWLGRKQSTEAMIQLLASQLHAATWGPVIAVGLGSAASIVCAAVIPYAVLRALDRKEPQPKKPNDKERKQNEQE